MITKSATIENEEDLVDITNVMFQFTQEKLSPDHRPTAASPTFSMQDSMAALQVMSPTMDCCAEADVPASQFRIPTCLKELGIVSLDEWTVSDVAEVAMHNIIRLEALLNGSNVLESTYACLLTHDHILRELRDELDRRASEGTIDGHSFALYASTACLVKSSELVHFIVNRADIYEEEDFDTRAMGVTFAHGVLEREANEIFSVGNLMEEAIKNLDVYSSEKAVTKLRCCLDVQHLFHESCSKMISFLLTDEVSTPADNSSFITRITLLKSLLSQTSNAFEKLESAINEGENTGSIVIQKVFNVFANRTKMGNSPVRKVRLKSAVNCVDSMKNIVTHIALVIDVVVKPMDYEQLKRMLRKRSNYSSANILPRSFLALTLYFNQQIIGQQDPHIFVKDAITKAGVPIGLLESTHGKNFIDRVVKPLYESMRLLSLNRHRQKECIDSYVLKDWSILQNESKIVDYHYREETAIQGDGHFFITNWILLQTLGLMEDSISLGTEAGIFLDELDSAFWYQDFLLSTHLNLLTASRNAIRETSTYKSAQNLKKTKGKKGNNKRSQVSSQLSIEPEDDVEFIYMSVRRTLCRGIFRFMMAIRQANISEESAFEFTSKSVILRKRYEQFSCIEQPTLLTYDDFLQGSDCSRIDSDRLISAALECFSAARTLIDQLTNTLKTVEDSQLVSYDIKDNLGLKKVCVGNTIYLQKLKNLLQNGNVSKGKVSVQRDFVHKHFCIIKVIEAET